MNTLIHQIPYHQEIRLDLPELFEHVIFRKHIKHFNVEKIIAELSFNKTQLEYYENSPYFPYITPVLNTKQKNVLYDNFKEMCVNTLQNDIKFLKSKLSHQTKIDKVLNVYKEIPIFLHFTVDDSTETVNYRKTKIINGKFDEEYFDKFLKQQPVSTYSKLKQLKSKHRLDKVYDKIEQFIYSEINQLQCPEDAGDKRACFDWVINNHLSIYTIKKPFIEFDNAERQNIISLAILPKNGKFTFTTFNAHEKHNPPFIALELEVLMMNKFLNIGKQHDINHVCDIEMEDNDIGAIFRQGKHEIWPIRVTKFKEMLSILKLNVFDVLYTKIKLNGNGAPKIGWMCELLEVITK